MNNYPGINKTSFQIILSKQWFPSMETEGAYYTYKCKIVGKSLYWINIKIKELKLPETYNIFPKVKFFQLWTFLGFNIRHQIEVLSEPKLIIQSNTPK